MEGGREGNKGRGREEEDRGRRKEGGRERGTEGLSWPAGPPPSSRAMLGLGPQATAAAQGAGPLPGES